MMAGAAPHADPSVMHRNLRRCLVPLAAAAIAGCSTADTSPGSKGGGVQAVMLRPGGTGNPVNVRFVDRGDGVTMTLFATNLPLGTYRALVHVNGNCTSPNFFSAGPAWAPAGSPVPANRLTPEFTTNSDGDLTLTMHIAGARTTGPDGLLGKSVVLHEGPVTEAVPGVRNERELCGVIGPLLSFFN
jgi:Cu/Zn superoxide dismutase